MSRIETLSAVFDCMIYLQAAVNEKSPAAELFRQVEKGNIRLFVSDETLDEIHCVFTRQKILAKYPHLTAGYVEIFLVRVLSKAELITKIPVHFEYSRDPKDGQYINLAVEAESNYIVSRDNDLLDLMKDYTDEAKDFRRRFRQIKIVNPVEFLQIIKENDFSIKT